MGQRLEEMVPWSGLLRSHSLGWQLAWIFCVSLCDGVCCYNHEKQNFPGFVLGYIAALSSYFCLRVEMVRSSPNKHIHSFQHPAEFSASCRALSFHKSKLFWWRFSWTHSDLWPADDEEVCESMLSDPEDQGLKHSVSKIPNFLFRLRNLHCIVNQLFQSSSWIHCLSRYPRLWMTMEDQIEMDPLPLKCSPGRTSQGFSNERGLRYFKLKRPNVKKAFRLWVQTPKEIKFWPCHSRKYRCVLLGKL